MSWVWIMGFTGGLERIFEEFLDWMKDKSLDSGSQTLCHDT